MTILEENFVFSLQPDGWYWREKEHQAGEWYMPTMLDPVGPFTTEQAAKDSAISWLDR